ncbi:MAG: xanthine dehydrogenase accessory protein XdhC [Rubrivivax sp.]|nr:xanthine dehydrogenase accessory protein XdhC [Rubrivivax sp.]
MTLKAEALAWLEAGRSAVVVSVDRTRGSVPREAGTRMLVGADAVRGTIGGGHLEWQAIDLARARIGHADELCQDVALGPTLGQCCGGRLTLRYAPLAAEALAAWPDEAPLFELQLYGAGHVGRALVDVLAGVPCRVWWIDEREGEFPPQAPPPQVTPLCVEPVEAEVAQAAPGTFYLVMTHSHDLDLRITEAILKRGDFGYLGLIGSKTKRERFLRRFEQRGIAAATLARLTCPIGVPGIGGKAPGVIALAVAAQLLQAAGA